MKSPRTTKIEVPEELGEAAATIGELTSALMAANIAHASGDFNAAYVQLQLLLRPFDHLRWLVQASAARVLSQIAEQRK